VKPLRILIATNHYGGHVRELPLSAALAATFAEAGHHVQVIAVSWSSPPGAAPAQYVEPSGVRVLFLTPRLVGRLGGAITRLTKWMATPLTSYFAARKHLGRESYDLLVGFTPAVASAGPFLFGLKRAAKSFVWIPDFFPFHHRLLGQIPGGIVFQIARLAETLLLRRFDVLGCFAPAAVDYLHRHYALRPEQKAAWVAQWGETAPAPVSDRNDVRARNGLPTGKTIALFGGQIELGRGIEDILEAARLAEASRPDLYFLFVGGGSLVPLVEARAREDSSNVGHIGALPREEYLALVAACDIGIVATVSGLNIPAFPSKTWDYLRAGLPVAASVEVQVEESGVDYAGFVEERQFGRSVEAGDPAAFLRCIEGIVDDPDAMERMRAAGRRALDEVHDVRTTAARILALTGLA
jgi:glycosyltransferase involved in cell wall biosynthesis